MLSVKPANPGSLLAAHKASFIVWVVLMTVHVLGHLKEAVLTSGRELSQATHSPAAPRRGLRLTLVALALILGVATATVLMPAAASWTTGAGDRQDR